MNEELVQLLTRALYIMVRSLGGTAEISREELEQVSTSEHAIKLKVDEATGRLIVKADSPSKEPKKQIFLIPTEDKTKEEIEKETTAAYKKFMAEMKKPK